MSPVAASSTQALHAVESVVPAMMAAPQVAIASPSAHSPNSIRPKASHPPQAEAASTVPLLYLGVVDGQGTCVASPP